MLKVKDIRCNPFGIWLDFQVTFRALKNNQNADRFSSQLALIVLEDFRHNSLWDDLLSSFIQSNETEHRQIFVSTISGRLPSNFPSDFLSFRALKQSVGRYSSQLFLA